MADCEMVAATLSDTRDIDEKIEGAIRERDEVVALNKALVTSQAAGGSMTDEQLKEYDLKRAEYEERYRKLTAKLERLQTEKQQRDGRMKGIQHFIDLLKDQPLVLPEWDAEVWNTLVSRVTVNRDGMHITD